MGSNPLERTSKLNSRLFSRDFLLFYFLRSITIYLKMIKKYTSIQDTSIGRHINFGLGIFSE
jgi:hypothetical protein